MYVPLIIRKVISNRKNIGKTFKIKLKKIK